MLKTIRPNKKLHYLTDILPKSNYNNNDEEDNEGGRKIKLSQSIKTKSSSRHLMMQQPNSKSINLPKLDRLILKNGISKIPIHNNS